MRFKASFIASPQPIPFIFVPGSACLSAIIIQAAEGFFPHPNDFKAAGFNDFHDGSKLPFGDGGIVILQQTSAGAGNPNFRRVGAGLSFRNMNVNRLQRVISLTQKKTRYPPILKTCGTAESSIPGQFDDDMRHTGDKRLIFLNFLGRESLDAFPAIFRQPANSGMEAIHHRFFDHDLDSFPTVFFDNFGVNDFRFVVQRHKRIQHSLAPFRLFPRRFTGRFSG
jgi:hypothetical protein